MSRSPLRSSRVNGPFPPVSDPHPKGLRKNTGRTSLSATQSTLGSTLITTCSCEHSAMKVIHQADQTSRSVCRSLRAIPPPDDLGTTQAGRNRIDHSHAGFPQGLLTRRICSYLVSYWLTNTIDRIVKDAPNSSGVALELPALPHTTCGVGTSLSPTDGIGRCKAALAARPGRRLTMVVSEARAILTCKSPRSTPLPGFLRQKTDTYDLRTASWSRLPCGTE